GPAQLLLRPESGDPRLIDVGEDKFGPAFCQLDMEPGAKVALTRTGDRIVLSAGGKTRSCQLQGISGVIGIGLSAAQKDTRVRDLRIERL
ncbi:MAG TPA: hypothetical protein VFZ61_12120, partial [Polyangiales bacterium]